MFKIAKEFQFDACHMLDGHKGKCHNLHGHTYRLIVEVSDQLHLQGSSKLSASWIMPICMMKPIATNVKSQPSFAKWSEKYLPFPVALLLKA